MIQSWLKLNSISIRTQNARIVCHVTNLYTKFDQRTTSASPKFFFFTCFALCGRQFRLLTLCRAPCLSFNILCAPIDEYHRHSHRKQTNKTTMKAKNNSPSVHFRGKLEYTWLILHLTNGSEEQIEINNKMKTTLKTPSGQRFKKPVKIIRIYP